jgi:ABC-type transport system involved in cytochrome c biogenesis permease subunit
MLAAPSRTLRVTRTENVMGLISGISLICFGASYAVAWAAEWARIFVRGSASQFVALAFVVAGFVAHTLYLGYRAFELSASPLSSSFDWCLVAAWLLMAAYLYLAWYFPKAPLGLYILPLVMSLVVAASLADRTPFAAGQASRVWGAIHGVFLLLGYVAVMVGSVAGLMYLVQSRRLKRKLAPAPGIRLPSLEWLERVNSRVIVLSALMIGVGFFAGVILNVVDRGGQGELPWSDPVIWSSALMLVWLLAAALFNVVYRPSRRGRKVAYLTVASLLFLVIALATLLWVNTEHGGQKPRERDIAGVASKPRGGRS